MQSIKYHLQKHGNGRTHKEYTQNAMSFFKLNKDKALKVTLKNGNSGYSIKLNENRSRVGGFWTEKSEIITFWD